MPTRRSRSIDRVEAQEIYDAYRTAALNAKYYGRRNSRLRKHTRWIGVAVAVVTSSSVTSFALFQTGWGAALLNFAGLSVAVLLVVRPSIIDEIAQGRYQVLHLHYTKLYDEIGEAVADLRLTQRTSLDLDVVRGGLERFAVLDDEKPDISELVRIQDEVNLQDPPTSFYWPPLATA